MAPSTPKYSIVVPTHDRPQLLAQRLASLTEQTVDDFEVIVVDDGDLGYVLPDDPRFRGIARPQGGVAAARNTGIKAARGEFVLFLDDDDLYLPERLELADRALPGRSVVLCWAESMEGNSPPWKRRLNGRCGPRMLEDRIPPMGCVAVRRDVTPLFDERYRVGEDVEWWVRLASAPLDLQTVEEVGTLQRHHAGPRLTERTRDRVLERLDTRIRLLRTHEAFFRAHRRAAANHWLKVCGLATSTGSWRVATWAAVRSTAAFPSGRPAAHLVKARLRGARHG